MNCRCGKDKCDYIDTGLFCLNCTDKDISEWQSKHMSHWKLLIDANGDYCLNKDDKYIRINGWKKAVVTARMLDILMTDKSSKSSGDAPGWIKAWINALFGNLKNPGDLEGIILSRGNNWHDGFERCLFELRRKGFSQDIMSKIYGEDAGKMWLETGKISIASSPKEGNYYLRLRNWLDSRGGLISWSDSSKSYEATWRLSLVEYSVRSDDALAVLFMASMAEAEAKAALDEDIISVVEKDGGRFIFASKRWCVEMSWGKISSGSLKSLVGMLRTQLKEDMTKGDKIRQALGPRREASSHLNCPGWAANWVKELIRDTVVDFDYAINNLGSSEWAAAIIDIRDKLKELGCDSPALPQQVEDYMEAARWAKDKGGKIWRPLAGRYEIFWTDSLSSNSTRWPKVKISYMSQGYCAKSALDAAKLYENAAKEAFDAGFVELLERYYGIVKFDGYDWSIFFHDNSFGYSTVNGRSAKEVKNAMEAFIGRGQSKRASLRECLAKLPELWERTKWEIPTWASEWANELFRGDTDVADAAMLVQERGYNWYFAIRACREQLIKDGHKPPAEPDEVEAYFWSKERLGYIDARAGKYAIGFRLPNYLARAKTELFDSIKEALASARRIEAETAIDLCDIVNAAIYAIDISEVRINMHSKTNACSITSRCGKINIVDKDLKKLFDELMRRSPTLLFLPAVPAWVREWLNKHYVPGWVLFGRAWLEVIYNYCKDSGKEMPSPVAKWAGKLLNLTSDKNSDKIISNQFSVPVNEGGRSMVKSFMKTALGSVIVAAVILLGPSAATKINKYFEEPVLSPLAKVVVEKLDYGTGWQIQQDGIACETMWIRGESEGRTLKSFDGAKSCAVFVRNASAVKDVGLSDQLASHEIKVILPKAKAIYERLLANKNTETAAVLLKAQPTEEPAPKKMRWSDTGKMLYDSLTKDMWTASLNESFLKSKNNQKLTVHAATTADNIADKNVAWLDSFPISLSYEEKVAVLERAVSLRVQLIDDVIRSALSPTTPAPVIAADK